MIDRLPALVAETKAAAANVEHPWDAAALDWPLTAESVVVEVGGYKGRWALQIVERYAPRLFVFEPQPWAYTTCTEVLGDRAEVINAALGTEYGMVAMSKWETDGCTITQPGGDHLVTMMEIRAVFEHLQIDHIDLMLMNIEGYEYTLLPHMLSQGILPQRLMVQAHGDLTTLIQQLDAAGYRVLWTYGAVLTAWERA